jgi:transcription initiation factor TFIIE subunit alpha
MLSKEEKDYITKVITKLFRPEASKIVIALLEKGEATEDWIAKETGIKMSLIRKLLYELYEKGYIIFKRERDEKTGWYIYYARFNLEKFNELLLERLKTIYEKKLKVRLEYEKNNTFFICPVHKKRYRIEEAIMNNYQCPEEGCGKILLLFDNSEYIKKLTEKMQIIENITNKLLVAKENKRKS